MEHDYRGETDIPETPAPTTRKEWEQWILDNYGERCPEFGGMECCVCATWALFDFITLNDN